MDPFVWGPLAWNLIFDICWRLDTKMKKSPEKKLHDNVETFFHLLTILLPCQDCCCSYREILKKLPFPNSSSSSYFHWAYHLKDFVNQKLEKKSPPIEEVYRRMQTISSASSANTIWDLLFMIGFHSFSFSTSTKNPIQLEQGKKRTKVAIRRLFEILPTILGGPLRIANSIANEIKRNPKPDLRSKKSFLLYLCKLSKRNLYQVQKQYLNCCLKKKTILLKTSELKYIRDQLPPCTNC
jgi:hypothetical protein